MTIDLADRYRGVPEVIYGTAFKFDDTASLVETAIKSGFKAVDTSGNKPQYRESLVGEGISRAIVSGAITRSELFVRPTLFEHAEAALRLHGRAKVMDPALYPYDVNKSIPDQVTESVSSSLANLNTDYIDCLVLHSLYPSMQDTLTAWRAMEKLVPETVSSLALSNVGLHALREIWEEAQVKPAAVQDRLTADTKEVPEAKLPPGLPYPLVPYDRDVREYCGLHDIAYAPWGLLWGNTEVMSDDVSNPLQRMADEIGTTKQVILYYSLRESGPCKYSILCGTTKESKMRQVIEGSNIVRQYVESGNGQKENWAACVDHLNKMINTP